MLQFGQDQGGAIISSRRRPGGSALGVQIQRIPRIEMGAQGGYRPKWGVLKLARKKETTHA